MRHRSQALALTVLVIGVTLTACSADPEPTQTPSAAPPASETTPSPEPAETEPVDEPVADPTCETIIAPSTIAIFEEHGWTYQEQEFRLGAEVVEGGLQCVWGDYTVASDHVQVFGWAPISATDSASAQQALLADGWIRADADGRTYITEDPQFSIAVDETGYGMTYEFGEGWVKLADTKQGLVLIKQP